MTGDQTTRAKLAIVAMLIATLGLGGAAASAAAPSASSGAVGQPWHRTELYFGLNRPGGEVTEAEFQHFLEVEVTKRFPDGLTLLGGLGQFKDGDTIVKEKSKVLILLYPLSDREAGTEIEQIRDAYKAQFDQLSVLRVDTIERVSF